MMTMNKKMALVAAGTLLATLGTAEAKAETEMQISANDLVAEITAHTSGAFDVGGAFTGQLQITENDPGDLETIFINGTADKTTNSQFLGKGFELILDFTNGSVTSGSLTVEVDSLDALQIDSYQANVVSGGLLNDFNGDLVLANLTTLGTFTDGDSDGEYADVSLSAFLPFNGEIRGRTVEIDLEGIRGSSTVGDFTTVADADVFAVVPSPTAALAAIPMLAVLGLRNRRRNG